ncbi:MAG: DNA mismatch repair endonuclease MutL [Chloroflexota bacterium]|nr:DNA mismatch repair endonuclease MutL [Chloroflexota bacterium]
MPIMVLEAGTAAKLAAGEVVERPASVVRELVDNALDAGARSVSVLITNGGLDLIRVVDDGSGLNRDDLPLCTARHATSKLRGIEDLTAIRSLGFRGEALHAVSSVSRLRIRTCKAGEPGIDAQYDGPSLTRETASGCPEGTQMEVRDLFYNTPARLRFLKGPSAEGNRIEHVVRRYVLGHPDVAFNLLIDGREVLRSSGSGDLREAVSAIYGWQMIEMLMPVEASEPAGSITGLVSTPSVSRANRSGMHVFVNHRWVQSRSLLFAIQEAYNSLLMIGRFPLAVLDIHVPPDRLDVNVHPAKSEVRFADERGVSSLVGRTVRAALLRASGGEGSEQSVSVAQFAFAATPAITGPVRPETTWGMVDAAPKPDGAEPNEPNDGRLPPLRILGQLASTYIIAEGLQGMCLVDQHAAHERILLERLQAADATGLRESQVLLEPLVVPLSGAQAEHAVSWAAEISTLGFTAEPFGGEALLIRAVPAEVPADRAASLLEELQEGLEGLETADQRHRAMLATTACHSAIRAGQVLDQSEMRGLIRDLERTRVPTACAHGRPTLLEISRLDLEREFGRRGSR